VAGVSKPGFEFFNRAMKRRGNFFSGFVFPFLSKFFPNFMKFLHKFWLFFSHLNLLWRGYIYNRGVYVNAHREIIPQTKVYCKFFVKKIETVPIFQISRWSAAYHIGFGEDYGVGGDAV
jgi:hypothetical protein